LVFLTGGKGVYALPSFLDEPSQNTVNKLEVCDFRFGKSCGDW